jgi:hypothetical protein
MREIPRKIIAVCKYTVSNWPKDHLLSNAKKEILSASFVLIPKVVALLTSITSNIGRQDFSPHDQGMALQSRETMALFV